MPLFVFAGAGLVLLCGALFGGVKHLRALAYPNHETSSHVQQLSTVTVEVGDPVPSDSANSTGNKTLTTTGGHLKMQVNPIYPAHALRDGIEGAVNAVLLVNEAGVVEEVRISSGDPLLASPVVSALGHWRYSTFYLGNHTVAC